MSEQKNRKLQPTPVTSNASPQQSVLPTFLDHIHELRRRFFWVAAFVMVVSAAVYPFQQQVINLLTAPLGDQQLYYTTPVGGFTFIIRICAYIGILAAIPLVVYHLYRYLEPLIMRGLSRKVIGYVAMSSVLAAGGVAFAYYISLPAALHFLTGLNISQIQAMLTVDSYLSFVMTYLLGAALLFQIPLILLIINGIKPLKPRKLMGFQRFVIVGAFIISAIISPTPDVMNQVILALPIIAMYQLGVILVWIQQKIHRPVKATQAVKPIQVPTPVTVNRQMSSAELSLEADLDEVLQDLQVAPVRPVAIRPVTKAVKPHTQQILAAPSVPSAPRPTRTVSMDGMRATVIKPTPRQIVTRPQPAAVVTRVPRQIVVPARSVDGLFARPSA